MRDPDALWRPMNVAGLPPDDYLAAARRTDLALAARELAACRRPVPEYDRSRDMGPTEAWRLFLADTDPEWSADVLELPAPREPKAPGAVA